MGPSGSSRAAVLALLASRPRELVTHDELRKALRGDALYVNFQQNLHYCIRQVRLALNQTGRESTIVESIPRRATGCSRRSSRVQTVHDLVY
jgi:DNA-binding winged helix-turn-helix (wHTH) protein